MNCRCLTFRIYFVLSISSHCVNTGSCRSLLGCNKFIYFLRGSSGGINQAPVVLLGSPGATCFKFSSSYKYPDAFWTLGSDQTNFTFQRSRYQGNEDSPAASSKGPFA